MRGTRTIIHGLFAILLGLAISAPQAAAQSCLAGGAPAACEYLPLSDDFGPVVDTKGIDDGRRWNPVVDPSADRLHRVTLNNKGIYTTRATCNDGSPAVMWVRRALVPGDEDKWVIVLEGGGAGFDAAGGNLANGMWLRWTDRGAGARLDWLKKASTDWRGPGGNVGRDGFPDVPMSLKVEGIFDSATSAFAAWNWVFVNYCSSDSWTGRITGLELPGAGSWTDAGVLKEGFKADLNGHYILEAAVALLRRNFAWGTDEDPSYEMPDIDLAATVLFASESAGGAGVSHNLDWLRDTLSSNNPGVTVLGSIGADLKPAIGVPVVDPWSVDVMPADGVDDMQAGLMSNFLQIQQINGFLDVSCMTALGDWRCTHTYQLVLDHITAAHFVKQDMTDNLLSAIYGPVAFHAGVTSAFADLEAAGIPFFGPNCGDHETLTNSPLHYSHTLRLRRWNAVAGVPFGPIRRRVSYNQALWNFYLHHPAPRPEDFAYSGKIDVFGGGDHIWLSSCP